MTRVPLAMIPILLTAAPCFCSSHTDAVSQVAYSPDGALLASGAGEGVVKLWETGSGNEIVTLPAQPGGVRLLAFDPQTGLILTTGTHDPYARVFDPLKRIEVARWYAGDIAALACYPVGSLCAMATGNEIWVRELQTGKFVHSSPNDAYRLGEARSAVTSLAFNQARPMIASGGDNGITFVRSAEYVDVRARVRAGTQSVRAVAFSADGKLLAVAGGVTVTLWFVEDLPGAGQPIADWKRAAEFPAHGVCALAFSPAGTQLAGASHDGGLHLWDTLAMRSLRELKDPAAAAALSVAFSRDGTKLMAGFSNGSLLTWSTVGGALLFQERKPVPGGAAPELQTSVGHPARILSISRPPNGGMACLGQPGWYGDSLGCEDPAQATHPAHPVARRATDYVAPHPQ